MHRHVATIIAHRGLHALDPENSLAAFLEARRRGFWWVELDVWPSADGVPVVIHDDTLDRTTTGTGPVRAQRWGQLSTLKLRDDDGRVDEHSTLPNLAEVIRAVASKAVPDAIGLLVDVKPPDDPAFVRAVVDLLERRCLRWDLQSFDKRNLIHARIVSRTPVTPYLIEDRVTLDGAIVDRWQPLHVRHDLLDAESVERMEAAELNFGAWTVNGETDLRRMIDLRVRTVITDEPLLARKLFEG